MSERYRVALGSRCLTRIHFTAKHCRFTSHRRKTQEIMTHLEAAAQYVCKSFIRYPCNTRVCFCDRTDVAWNDPAEQINQHGPGDSEKRAALSSDRCAESESIWRLAKYVLTLYSGPETIKAHLKWRNAIVLDIIGWISRKRNVSGNVLPKAKK